MWCSTRGLLWCCRPASWHNVAGIGDAENDHVFMRQCECSIAVANALESVKQTADIVTEGDRGRGVQGVQDALVSSDPREYAPELTRAEVMSGRIEQAPNASPAQSRTAVKEAVERRFTGSA
jgi:hypothetical protein